MLLSFESELVRFLIKKNVVLRYRRNLRDHKLGIVRKGVRLRMQRLIKPLPPDKYIQSFYWKHTKEGKMFWSNINRKWQKELKKLREVNSGKYTNGCIIK